MIICDRCGGQTVAQVLVWIGNRTLYFCLHHYNQHADALADYEYEAVQIHLD